ncbi:uncharacterized protein B0H18DRAFT_1207689 [Fomitopsis serialis]|uniref:uncharacterized protein n=1 Tax=Fomitopsis serialis TaxID=139415 RepID=UPI0020075A05|nr:uncharacterized protein B0H18DRAFT_1207689 [Neoantrodia serialis]KAH9934142.1 hypothetical protein B0H18DRAFT_1207689 [Neoantrodia serialis]
MSRFDTRRLVDALSDSSSDASSPSSTAASSVDGDLEENQLLVHQALDDRDTKDHELQTAPVFTREAYARSGGPDRFPQRGLLGSVVRVYDGSGPCTKDIAGDKRIYLNTNAPFSALVCGVQGSGKSHTTSVMLENMLVPSYSAIGQLKKPLAGLVLHFGEGGAYSQPCEAAWVGITDNTAIEPPPVVVYVSKSSLNTMKKVYARLGPSVVVRALKFSEEELDAQAFLSMMAIGASDHVPLYMQTVLSILRELGEKYTYHNFKMALEQKKSKFNPAQLAGLEQRTALLEAFLDKKGPGKFHVAPARFAPGQLTIIDLSDPFIDPASACGFFEILVRLFVRAQVDTGKVLVVDEAHKYLVATKTSSGLTKELLSLIRQQRHQAMRVIISTQEPTVVPPVLLELCGVTILHRFSSPAWWEHVAKHVSADIDSKAAFDTIVNLQTGQAVLLAPTGLGTTRDLADKAADDGRRVLSSFGRKCVLIKTRLRITKDGGASLLVVPSS